MPPTKIMLKCLNVMIPLVIILFIYYSSNISGPSTVPCSTPWPGKLRLNLFTHYLAQHTGSDKLSKPGLDQIISTTINYIVSWLVRTCWCGTVSNKGFRNV